MWAVGLRSNCSDLPELNVHIGAFFSVQGDVHMRTSAKLPIVTPLNKDMNFCFLFVAIP